MSSDRAAASPPCEVSSTTINNEEKNAGNGNKEKSSNVTSGETNQATAKNITTEVIAETSETVEIEGACVSIFSKILKFHQGIVFETNNRYVKHI